MCTGGAGKKIEKGGGMYLDLSCAMAGANSKR
jgi:hypothetical protein